MSDFFEDDGLITEAERANTRQHAAIIHQRGLETVRVITAAIPIIRQQQEDEDA